MQADYDILEKLPDGSYVWRACVPGRHNTERKLQELAEFSDNEFYALTITARDSVTNDATAQLPGPVEIIKGPKRNVA